METESNLSLNSAIRGWIVENLEVAHQRQSRYYNRHHRPMTYNLNDKVLYRDYTKSSAAKNISAKLLKEYKGPYQVIEVISPLIYTIMNSQGVVQKQVSVVDLKPYKSKSYMNKSLNLL